MRRPLRLLGVLVVFAIPLAVVQLPPVRAALLFVLAAMREGGPEGAALYVASYALGAVFTAPFGLLSGMAGYAYGPVRGLLIASPASVLGATTAFLLGRYALRSRIARYADHLPQFHAIQRAVDGDALRIAGLLRLTPVAPQNFLTYALSVTRLRVRTFMLATWVGLLPATAFQVYVGSLVRDATELLDGKRPPLGPLGWAVTVAALVLTGGAVAALARLARRALATSGVLLGDPGAP